MKKIVPQNSILIPDSAECKFQGVIYSVYQWPQQTFDGSTATFEMIKRPDTVGAICVVDDTIMVLKDEQPHRGTMVTFPGGRVETEEDVTDAIKREVHEETGYSFKNWKLLKVRQPHLKIEWFIYTFICWDVEGRATPHLDGGEKITVDFLSFDKVLRLVKGKAGYLGEEEDIFIGSHSTQDLLALPEYQGKTVDR